MLDLQIQRRKENKKHLSGYDMCSLLPSLKKDEKYAWLRDISSTSLQSICLFLAHDYDLFFKKQSGFPKFKSKKKSKPCFPIRKDGFYFIDNYVQIPKVGKIKYKSDCIFPEGNKYNFVNICLSVINKKYILSFGMECENQAQPVLSDIPMGIDLGVKELAVVAYGEEQFVFNNINKSSKVRDIKCKVKHTQRTISRKYEASKAMTGKYDKTNNIKREEEKLRKLNMRLSNIRHNYLHQTTHKLVSMLPNKVVMEDLNVSGMTKNKYLSRAIQEQCFYEFIRQMKYKCEWSGIPFVQVDRFYPSSKTCSCCGSIKRDLKLSDRTYICPDCGLVIDRDYNAAINLMKYGTH